MLLFLAKIVAHKLIIPNEKLVVKVQMTFPWLQFTPSEHSIFFLGKSWKPRECYKIQRTKSKDLRSWRP